jgi:hypothetical protein
MEKSLTSGIRFLSKKILAIIYYVFAFRLVGFEAIGLGLRFFAGRSRKTKEKKATASLSPLRQTPKPVAE